MPKNKKRTDIINFIIKKYGFKTYLEIGVRNPKDNFNNINVNIKHGVDPKPKGEITHKMTSDAFFKQNNSVVYDLIFIDGLHTEKQATVDIHNSIKHLSDNGVIVMHDCNPPTEHYIRDVSQYKGGPWCGTTFRAYIKAKYELSNNYGCCVINEETGIGIISKRYDIPLKLKYDVEFLEWKKFDLSRKEILNIISLEEFKKLT